MTREEVLARYDPIRASIKRVLKLAGESCGKAEWARAMKQVAPWAEPAALAEAPEPAPGMMTDVALFEPNQRGRRAFDRFLAGKAGSLAVPDIAVARRMAASAVFSVFRFAARHEAAGLWLEDMLGGDRRLWLVDRSLEGSAPEGAVCAMRLFEAEAFHAGFGIIAPVAEDMLDFCVGSAEAGRLLPVRHSLAATLYGDLFSEELPPSAELAEALLGLFESEGPETPLPAAPPPSRRRKKV